MSTLPLYCASQFAHFIASAYVNLIQPRVISKPPLLQQRNTHNVADCVLEISGPFYLNLGPVGEVRSFGTLVQ